MPHTTSFGVPVFTSSVTRTQLCIWLGQGRRLRSQSYYAESSFNNSIYQVTHDHLDCLGMTLLWRVVEASNLTDCKRDIGTCVGRQIQQHADDGRVKPLFTHGFSIRIRAKSHRRSRSPIWVAVLHARSIDYLLDTYCKIYNITKGIKSTRFGEDKYKSS